MFDRRVRRAALKTSTAAVALLAFAAPGVVHAQAARYSFDIPSQDVSSALIAYGRAARQQLVFDGTSLRSKQSAALVGEYSAQEGLSRLLEGTGLHAEYAGSGAIRIVSASNPQSGSAAGDGADAGTVQALIVTAQKREENIQDVPIAMSAFTQEDLTRSQIAGGPDLMTQVPNFTFTKTNFSSYSIQIRGIGTQAISATTDAAVAVAFNNTPFIRNRFFEQEFYDLQRVEVLRGPQGTLYGRNATAGVVNIISAKPTFHYEAKLSADVGNYNSTRLEGMVNVPLVEDKVALRLAGAWTKRDGYDTNQITGNRIDGRDLWSTRLSLRFAPTDKINANLIWEHFKEDDDRLRSGKQLCKKDVVTEIGGIDVPYYGGFSGVNPPLYQQFFSQGCAPASLYSPDSFQTPNGFALPYYQPLIQVGVPIRFPSEGFDPYASTTQSRDLRVIESTVDPRYTAETDTVELQFSLDLPHDLTLTSETGYLSDTLFSTQDFNRFNTTSHAFNNVTLTGQPIPRGAVDSNGVFCDPQIGCADRLVAVDLSTADSRHFSQEFRLASNFDGRFNFSLGANFLRYDTEDKYYVFINTLSMTAAINGFGGGQTQGPWLPGVSDNTDCLREGMTPPDPHGVSEVTGCIYIDPNPIGSLNDMGHNYFLSRNPYKLISYAVFGEAYYNVTPNLKLTAGLRWTVDRKQAPRIPSWVLAARSAGYPVADVSQQEWREPTGRLTVDWKPDFAFTDETLLYASYAHGYKAGGANPPANGLVMYSVDLGKVDWANLALQQAATHPKTFDPEFVDAFEVGTKNTLLGGSLTLNTDAFYYDYTGYQISQIVDRSALNLNFDAKIWGLELETDWRPVENLRFGLKVGYERTRMADGSKAVDLMDRANGGKPDANGVSWFVTHPFPTLPSNCILPTYVVVHSDTDTLGYAGNAGGGGLGPCEMAYVLGQDPLTGEEYTADPQSGLIEWYPGYPGFNPHTAPNGGAGFDKDLSGHELPNAPHYTATVTADYTIPLPNNWLATLHTDLYYQSEAWTRVFNTPGYDKLKAYTNVNLAAIFTNEDAGWKVMAYVKNVMDRDSITGAFLNSDDTGLTTNVFLTEPRLYGLRVTKEWTGQGWWTGANPNHPAGDPYPLTVELGGQVQRHDAPYETMTPSWMGQSFPQVLDLRDVQNRDLDWGDGRSIRATYQPSGSAWRVSVGARYARTNSDTARRHAQFDTADACALPAPFGSVFCDPASPNYQASAVRHATDWADASATNKEDDRFADLQVGRDVGLGGLLDHSSVALGLRYARLHSTTRSAMTSAPDWVVPDGWFFQFPHYDRYAASVDAERQFKGAGPSLDWEGAARLLGNEETGRLNADWSVGAAALFGKQRTNITGMETATYWIGNLQLIDIRTPTAVTPIPPIDIHRGKSVTVPVVDLNLGLSYEIQRIKIGAGYRWERYFNALDAGYVERKSDDRTIDGPYFKIAVGFGG